MSNIALVVRYDVKPAYRTEFEQVIRAHATATLNSEEGCLQFDVLIPRDDTVHVHLYEVYRDEESYAEHTRGRRLSDLRERYKDMLDRREIVICAR